LEIGGLFLRGQFDVLLADDIVAFEDAAGFVRLQLYDWPGNVRELENAVERELIRSQAQEKKGTLRFEEIGASQIKQQEASPITTSPHAAQDMDLNAVMRAHITHVLSLTNGRIQGPRGAAALLGVQPNTLRHRMRKIGIPYGVRS
jgi:DNA-binding NtrC family response regulator